MNKKLAAVLAATCVLGATTAFAANPFSDVTPNDWAYQAVAQLAAEGVIDGYPDGTFKGERNITRYEMAQMVARAMARQEMVDAQQQAQINRLADEFANELNSLGVRVTNLENRVGNVKLTGDARVRWQDTGVKDKFDMRVRMEANGKVAENTNVMARLSSGSFGFDSGKDAKVDLDALEVAHSSGDLTLRGGRYDLTFGTLGYWYDGAFDGAELGYSATDSVTASVGYGYAKDMSLQAIIEADRVALLASQVAAAEGEAAKLVATEQKAATEAETKLTEASKKAEAAGKAEAAAKKTQDAANDAVTEKTNAANDAKTAKDDADQAVTQATQVLEDAKRNNNGVEAAEKALKEAQTKAAAAKDVWTKAEKAKADALKEQQAANNAHAKAVGEKTKAEQEKVTATGAKTAADAKLAARKAKQDYLDAMKVVNEAKKEQEDFNDKKKDVRKDFLAKYEGAVEMTYGTLGYTGHGFTLLGTYIAPNGDNVQQAGLDRIWGAALAVDLGKELSLGAEYYNVGWKKHSDAKFLAARLGFGKASMKKPGSFGLFVDYVDSDDRSYLGGTGSLRDDNFLDGVKSWGVGADVVVAPNVKLTAFRTFNSETQNGKDLNDEYTRVQLVYKF